MSFDSVSYGNFSLDVYKDAQDSQESETIDESDEIDEADRLFDIANSKSCLVGNRVRILDYADS